MGWMPTTMDPIRSQELLLAHPGFTHLLRYSSDTVRRQLQAPTDTDTADTNVPATTARRDASPSSLMIAGRQKIRLESLESGRHVPVQNLDTVVGKIQATDRRACFI